MYFHSTVLQRLLKTKSIAAIIMSGTTREKRGIGENPPRVRGSEYTLPPCVSHEQLLKF